MSESIVPLILDAAQGVDGQGSVAGLLEQVAALSAAGLQVQGLEIDALGAGWGGRPGRGGPRFHSGCAPILALDRARELLGAGAADAVVIRGEDPLRTGYDPAERRRLMQVYGETSVPEVYTSLARAQMARLGLTEAAYRHLADQLLDNCARTARRRGLATSSAHGGRAATSLFRYADCADPNVDYEGAVLLGSARAAQILRRSSDSAVGLLGVGVQLAEDGPEHVEDLVDFAHLQLAYEEACAEAGLDFAARFCAGEALAEAYTCFPPIPIGFLLATGIAADVRDVERVLAHHEITVTGGLNLARAPWSNSALRGLIVLWQRLTTADRGDPRLGLVHGNGGMGGYQGVAIIGVGAA